MSVRILAEAEAEILSALLYYENAQAGLGEDFYDRVSRTITAIERDPRR